MASIVKATRQTGFERKPLTRRIRQYLNQNGAFWLMALPGLLLIFVFAYGPLPGIVIAFKNYKFNLGIWGSEWAGLTNFQFLFRVPQAASALGNTLFMNGLFILTGTVVSFLLALLMNEVHTKLRARFFQSAMFFPHFISAIIISYFVLALLSTDTGIINKTLVGIGLEPVEWYSSPEHWPVILMLVNIWKGAGYGSLLYLAGMLAVSPELYEAARIDGASKIEQIRFITVPLLVPVLIITTLLAIGRILFADFGLFFVVTRDTPALYPTTDVIDTFVYRGLRKLGDVGMSAAASFAQSVIGFMLVLVSNLIVRKIDPERALF